VSNKGPLAEPRPADCDFPPAFATDALSHMEQALDLLDQLGDVGGADAHLDMAIHRLRGWLGALDGAKAG